ncbi:ROK family protein [Aporhodopirellula aestuarii]|uniref:ROK family protein n=1 Tax=Aporhodopirellula aestuarii TaxID=2950107 RepID=A0ABT0U674_9BACT|nr:ROK family protein [Aporhodopirellula aestuarii]MCM2372447.1 ROK family protein [Aporhodopirellula aestuarii]
MKDIWIGFDLGGTKMLAVAYDNDMKPLARRRRKTRGREGSDNGIARIISTITRLLDENDIDPKRIAAIGIGCPGPIDLNAGRLLSTPNLGWDNVDIQKVLTKQFDCRVAVLNDVDAGVYGEYRFGAAENSRCAVGLFPGTGIGGGCVYEGKILHGAGISCMEIGHTRISAGVRCSGGEIPGTLETEASRLSIAAEAAKLAYRGEAPALLKIAGTDISEIRSGALAESIKNGDKEVKRLIEEAATVIGYAVVNIVHILCPDKIILGGGLVEALEDILLSNVRKVANECVMPVYKNRFKVVAAKLGDDAGVMGSAAWAKMEFGSQIEEENTQKAAAEAAKKEKSSKEEKEKEDAKKEAPKSDDAKKAD